jgi:deoxyribose-phosphate aldolase
MDKPNFSTYFSVQEEEIQDRIFQILKSLNEPVSLSHLKTMFSCLDLTNLNPAATDDEIKELVDKTVNLGADETFLFPAGICLYPNKIAAIKETKNLKGIKLITVAGGFPHGQLDLKNKLQEIETAIANGADEIDVVINRSLILSHKFDEAYAEMEAIRKITQGKTLKVILETGEMPNLKYVLIAADIALYTGADFLKTSTGTIEKGANVESLYVMLHAIKRFYEQHGKAVGIKISGGVSNISKAHQLYLLVGEILGEKWLNKEKFRIGSTKLAKLILNEMAIEVNNYELRNYY